MAVNTQPRNGSLVLARRRDSRILKGMKRYRSSPWAHRLGKRSLVVAERLGPVRVEWDQEATMTPLGQLLFFIRFLHRGAALRRRAARPPRDEEDRHRGRDPARLQGGRRDGRGRLAAPTPAILCGAAAGRAWILDVDTTIKPLYGHQEGAVLRYKSQEAGTSEPLLSHVFDGFDASDPLCRCHTKSLKL